MKRKCWSKEKSGVWNATYQNLHIQATGDILNWVCSESWTLVQLAMHLRTWTVFNNPTTSFTYSALARTDPITSDGSNARGHADTGSTGVVVSTSEIRQTALPGRPRAVRVPLVPTVRTTVYWVLAGGSKHHAPTAETRQAGTVLDEQQHSSECVTRWCTKTSLNLHILLYFYCVASCHR
jgi:hypothetical protein